MGIGCDIEVFRNERLLMWEGGRMEEGTKNNPYTANIGGSGNIIKC